MDFDRRYWSCNLCHILFFMSRLQADSIIKSYQGRPVLTDIFISCDEGEILGLLGRNGSGKSTLLKIIFGSLKADYRYVSVDGIYIHGISDGSSLIKYLPQDDFIPNHINIGKAITLFCNKHNAERLSAHPVVSSILNRKCRELSGGQRRFFEVLLILYSDAKYLLLDEPFNGLSPLHVHEIKGIIREQSAQKGIIVTDHDYRNILDVASRVVLIHDGAMKNIDDTDSLRRWGYIL